MATTAGGTTQIAKVSDFPTLLKLIKDGAWGYTLADAVASVEQIVATKDVKAVMVRIAAVFNTRANLVATGNMQMNEIFKKHRVDGYLILAMFPELAISKRCVTKTGNPISRKGIDIDAGDKVDKSKPGKGNLFSRYLAYEMSLVYGMDTVPVPGPDAQAFLQIVLRSLA